MEMVNEMYDYTSRSAARTNMPVLRSAIDALTLLISPFAPHFAEELWEALGNKGSIANAAWPQHDPEAIVATEITVVVQVNGKVRSKLTRSGRDLRQGDRDCGACRPKVREFTNGKSPEEGDRGPGQARERGGVAMRSAECGMRNNRIKALVLVLLACCSLSSCGYHFSGTGAIVPEGVRTLAVPVFFNETNEPYVDVEVTQAVVEEFMTDGRLKIVSLEEAELALRGKDRQV